MELKKIFKSTSQLGISRVIQAVLGIVRSKLLAMLVGTTGIGIINQVNFTSRQLSKFTLLGMNDGLTKQIAESKKEDNFRDIFCSAQKAYIVLNMIVTIIAIILILFFSEKLTIYFFGDIKYFKYFLIAVIIFPTLLLNSYSRAVLKAFKLIKYIARTQIIASVASFVVFIPLVFLYDIYGAIISIVVMFVVQLMVNTWHAKKKVLSEYKITYKDILKSKIDDKRMKELMVFGGFGLTLGLYQIVADVFGRSILINQLGIDHLGIYAPALALGDKFQTIVVPALYTYLYPRFSELKNNHNNISNVVNDSWRMVGFFSMVMLFFGISSRYLLVPLLYSHDFIDAAKYIPGHFLGIMFFMIAVPLSQVFTPTGRIKIYSLFQFFRFTLRIVVIYFFVPLLGLGGYMLRFIIPPFLFGIIFFLYLRKEIKLKIDKKNILLFSYIIGGSTLLYFISEYNSHISIILGILLILTTYFILTKKEKEQIKGKIQSLFKRKKR